MVLVAFVVASVVIAVFVVMATLAFVVLVLMAVAFVVLVVMAVIAVVVICFVVALGSHEVQQRVPLSVWEQVVVSCVRPGASWKHLGAP